MKLEQNNALLNRLLAIRRFTKIQNYSLAMKTCFKLLCFPFLNISVKY